MNTHYGKGYWKVTNIINTVSLMRKFNPTFAAPVTLKITRIYIHAICVILKPGGEAPELSGMQLSGSGRCTQPRSRTVAAPTVPTWQGYWLPWRATWSGRSKNNGTVIPALKRCQKYFGSVGIPAGISQYFYPRLTSQIHTDRNSKHQHNTTIFSYVSTLISYFKNEGQK